MEHNVPLLVCTQLRFKLDSVILFLMSLFWVEVDTVWQSSVTNCILTDIERHVQHGYWQSLSGFLQVHSRESYSMYSGRS